MDEDQITATEAVDEKVRAKGRGDIKRDDPVGREVPPVGKEGTWLPS